MLGLIVDHEIAGMSCDIRIDEYEPGNPGFFSGHPDNWEPEQPPVIVFKLIRPDTGKPWTWLQSKMSDKEEAIVENLIIERMEAEIEA